jgi:hypothetical protein
MWSIFAPALITGDRGIELRRLNEIQAAELNRMVAAARPALLEIEAIARMDDDSQRDYAKPRNAGRGCWGPAHPLFSVDSGPRNQDKATSWRCRFCGQQLDSGHLVVLTASNSSTSTAPFGFTQLGTISR